MLNLNFMFNSWLEFLIGGIIGCIFIYAIIIMATGIFYIVESIKIRRQNKLDIVLCKECKHAYISDFAEDSGICMCLRRPKTGGVVMQQDDFCSYSERKD